MYPSTHRSQGGGSAHRAPPAETAPAPSASASPPSTPPVVNLLLLVTGSVAAVKLGLFLDEIQSEVCHVRIATTQSALHFLHRAAPSRTGIPFQSIISDESEWSSWEAAGDSILHIELRKWADLVLIIPLDANSLAKISNGLCDNLVSCVMRAWYVRQRPVLVCPAMNTAMWDHPVTHEQLLRLQDWYSYPEDGRSGEGEVRTASPSCLPATHREALFQVIGPVSKKLACGDIGNGGMAAVEDIAMVVRHTMQLIREQKRNNNKDGEGTG